MENRRRPFKPVERLNDASRRYSTANKNRAKPGSRLASQRPGRKSGILSRGRPRNIYRRSRREGKKRSWRGPALVFLGLSSLGALCLGLVFLYHQLLTCSLFCIKDIRNIEVEGTHRLPPELILRLAKLGPDTNLLALRPGQVERTLLTHPWVARAEVTRKWPQRLHLKIRERAPVALVQLEGELYYVGRQGNLFKPMSPGDPHNFPVITGLKPEHFGRGETGMPEILAQAFQLLEVLKTAPPPLNLENISEIHADLERGFAIYANGLGGPLELGLKDFSPKLQKFAHIWPALAQKGYAAKIGRINLDYPQRALVTLKGEEN